MKTKSILSNKEVFQFKGKETRFKVKLNTSVMEGAERALSQPSSNSQEGIPKKSTSRIEEPSSTNSI
jgi:hypothetical protein